MFIDYAKIKLQAGNGGTGVVAFHREKYIDKGKIQLEFVDYPLDRLAVIAAALARTLPSNEGYINVI